MTKKDFLELSDFSKEELLNIISYAQKLKANPVQNLLPAKQLAMIFEKNSTRTRVSFEVGMNQLGGDAVILNSGNTQLGRGESISDTAKVLSRYVDIIMIRANNHQDAVNLAKEATIPVVNGLTDYNHPCQIMADILTFIEHRGDISGKIVSWIGDGNNVLNSWLNAAVIFGFKLQLALKENYYPDADLLDKAEKLGLVQIFDNPHAAAGNADLITTDTWVSMGDKDHAERLQAFADLQINQGVIAKAKSDALFMHCLPAHRGEEVTSEVIDGTNSVIFDEAENRLHIQKAIICYLLGVY